MAGHLSEADMQQLKERLERYRTQYNIADTAALDRGSVEDLYKRDAEFTAFDIAPPLGGYIGWESYAAAWSKVLGKYRKIIFDFNDDLRIFGTSDAAWMSFSSAWHGITKGGETFHKDMRMTLVWVRDEGVWRITHEHGSSPVNTRLAGGEVI